MDPATWSWLTCAWLLQTSLGGILGNRLDAKATAVWTQSWQAFTQSLSNDYQTPANRDLEISVYRAFLLAQQSLVCDCLAEFTQGSWTPRKELTKTGYALSPGYQTDVDWLRNRYKEIKADLKRLQKGDYTAISPQAFEASVELLLTERGLVAADAENLLRRELADGVLAAGISERYRERAIAPEIGLFERTSAFFAFELKTNPAVQSLFQNQLLLQMNTRLQELSVQPVDLERIAEQLKAVAKQLPDVLTVLDNLEIAVRDLGKSVDEVGWLVAHRTDDLIALAISHADDLAELKQMVADLLSQQSQWQISKPSTVHSNLDYRYDVFLSYNRQGSVARWVKNHLFPTLRDKLIDYYNNDVTIYHDEKKGTGDWPIDVKEALDSSRYMVSVWSPSYFRSSWCLSEFYSIKAREKQSGLDSESHLLREGLCFPIVFCDGKNFPEEIKLLERKDLSQWNYAEKYFRQTIGFLELSKEIEFIAEHLAEVINNVPERQAWPSITLEEMPVEHGNATPWLT